jgi:predicted solute-binding protein
MTRPKRRIGIVPDLVARPLFTKFGEPEFDVVRGVPGALALKLREQQLDGAFLSPIDVVRAPGGLRPAGGGSLVARAGGNTARMLFREGIREIRTLSVDPGRTSEIVLAHLVLVEQYDTAPKIVPRKGTPEEGLLECDAVLVAGDEATGARAVEDGLDLVEEWMEISDLPFVHGLWYVRDGAFEGDSAGLFSCDAPGSGAGPVSYDFDDEARSGLSEFIRMAYYHGILREIPEFSTFLPGHPA